MSFTQSVGLFFTNYFDFQSRASRSEFWYALLFCFLAGIATSLVDGAAGKNIFNPLLTLATFIPSISLQVRRLHDVDRTGWWAAVLPGIAAFAIVAMFLAIGPIQGPVVAQGAGASFAMLVFAIAAVASLVVSISLLVWYCQAGSWGHNQYGPNPLG